MSSEEYLKEKIVELIRKTATELPEDVVSALREAKRNEESAGAKDALSGILENVDMAKDGSRSLCQDTGMPLFYVTYPRNHSQDEIRIVIENVVKRATEAVPLRPNVVDCLTGKNLGNIPKIHFEEGDELGIQLMLKGGGSENVSAVYKLPDIEISAHRDLAGVRKCIIDAVLNAQGKGCPPYIIGVATGGSIEDVAHESKKQLLRRLDDRNPNPDLAAFEDRVLKDVNTLGI